MRIIHGFSKGKEVLKSHRNVLQGQSEISADGQKKIREIFKDNLSPEQVVTRILDDVRSKGDASIKQYSKMIDNVDINHLEVPKSEWAKAYKDIPRRLREALVHASKRIRAFHEASKPQTWINLEEGYGELFNPLDRVGVYIPGGSAVYPSTVLMTAIPAKVAGVKDVIVASPASGVGGPSQGVLAAAHLAEVDRVFQIGGAQAIGAFAYGTESVPKVDFICGPGNIFVTIAKRMVYGEVGIDGLYGPTETVVIADSTAPANLCAADVLAQAEHDTMASPIFITTSDKLVSKVEREIEKQLLKLPRKEIARVSINERGYAIVVESLSQAAELANDFAPEHLCLLVDDPWKLLDQVRHAGGVFLGSLSPEVMGDYVAGPSHTMPTGGTARFNSPLGVHHFLKVSSLVAVQPKHMEQFIKVVSTIARSEGFVGHAKAAEIRKSYLSNKKLKNT